MEVSLQTREFIRKALGVPVLLERSQVKMAASDLLLYLKASPTPEQWIIILFNPELRASLLAILLYLNKEDDDLTWSILITKLEDTLEEETKAALGAKTFAELEETATEDEAIAIFHEAFRLIGREAASSFTNELLSYVLNSKRLVKRISYLAHDS